MLLFSQSFSPKSSTNSYYCSKLVWKSYKEGANLDIDDNGGVKVTPSDIYDDSDTKKIYSYTYNY